MTGPAGEVQLEPLIMQVFLLLLDARGRVVTRQQLFDDCWGGVIVGDDSLNRAVAKVRRIESQVAPGLFAIETIPRTGYRLTGEIVDHLKSGSDALHTPVSARAGMSRRKLMVGGSAAALAVLAGGAGLWSVRRSDTDRRFDALVNAGAEALRDGSPTTIVQAADYLESAAAMRPENAQALGLFAYAKAMAADYGVPSEAGAAVQAAEQAARAALALDSAEANARLALILVQRSLLDLGGTEDRLRAILATAPANLQAMKHLWDLLQSSGQSRAAYAMNERGIALHPLAASANYPRAQLLWILDRNAEADSVIDRAMRLWPGHAFVRFARFTIYAFTGRPRAALAMLDDDTLRPQRFTPAGIAVWRKSLIALDQRSPTSIAEALRTNLDAATQTPGLASQAVLVLSALGELDAAFEIANQLLVFRRANEPDGQAGSSQPVRSTAWRFTPWLFTPPARPMWSDPRFGSLCEGIGFTDYWRARGIRPDYQLARA